MQTICTLNYAKKSITSLDTLLLVNQLATMEYCPPYSIEDPNSWYFIVLHITFCISLIVNVYVFYCIIFLSNRQMKTYRWYLLWHQILVFSADITVRTFLQYGKRCLETKIIAFFRVRGRIK